MHILVNVAQVLVGRGWAAFSPYGDGNCISGGAVHASMYVSRPLVVTLRLLPQIEHDLRSRPDEATFAEALNLLAQPLVMTLPFPAVIEYAPSCMHIPFRYCLCGPNYT